MEQDKQDSTAVLTLKMLASTFNPKMVHFDSSTSSPNIAPILESTDCAEEAAIMKTTRTNHMSPKSRKDISEKLL